MENPLARRVGSSRWLIGARAAWLGALLTAAGCDGGGVNGGGGTDGSDASVTQGEASDGAGPQDLLTTRDATMVGIEDSATRDLTMVVDSSPPIDATSVDQMIVDASRMDAAVVDAAVIDAAVIDAAAARDLGVRPAPDLVTVDLTDCNRLGKMPSDPFTDRVVSFSPGPNAGFGQNLMPQIVLGPPQGAGALMGSTDTVSLGNGGSIVLAFDDIGVVDGPGVDLIVFENPFSTYLEPGVVSVSEDGVTWRAFPCDPLDVANSYPGCAGVHPVFSNSRNGISPIDPRVSGGDLYDLATIGVKRARYVKIVDTGHGFYFGTTGGFDLDALAVVNGAPVACW